MTRTTCPEMSPEQWNAYWRNCHITPLQILEMERTDMITFFAQRDGFYRSTLDAMELQMMGVKP